MSMNLQNDSLETKQLQIKLQGKASRKVWAIQMIAAGTNCRKMRDVILKNFESNLREKKCMTITAFDQRKNLL